jgi:hypothetical protein
MIVPTIDENGVVHCGRCGERFGYIILDAGPHNRFFVLDGHNYHRTGDTWEQSPERARRGHVRVISGIRVPTRKSPAAGERMRCSRCTWINDWPGAKGVK